MRFFQFFQSTSRFLRQAAERLAAVAAAAAFIAVGGCADADMAQVETDTLRQAWDEARIDVESYEGNREGLVDRLEGAVGLRWSVNGSRNNCGTGTPISPDLFLTVYETLPSVASPANQST